MNPTMQEMLEHPLMSQVVSDLVAKKSEEQRELTNATLKANEVRTNSVKDAKVAFDQALQAYERGRAELHERVGAVFLANLTYSRLTGHPHPSFAENVFMTIHIPKLNSPNDWSTSYSSTQQAYQSYFVSQRWT